MLSRHFRPPLLPCAGSFCGRWLAIIFVPGKPSMFMLPGPLSDGGSVSMCVGYSVSVGREIYSAIPTALAHRAEVEQLFGADWEIITVFYVCLRMCPSTGARNSMTKHTRLARNSLHVSNFKRPLRTPWALNGVGSIILVVFFLA